MCRRRRLRRRIIRRSWSMRRRLLMCRRLSWKPMRWRLCRLESILRMMDSPGWTNGGILSGRWLSQLSGRYTDSWFSLESSKIRSKSTIGRCRSHNINWLWLCWWCFRYRFRSNRLWNRLCYRCWLNHGLWWCRFHHWRSNLRNNWWSNNLGPCFRFLQWFL